MKIIKSYIYWSCFIIGLWGMGLIIGFSMSYLAAHYPNVLLYGLSALLFHLCVLGLKAKYDK